VLRYDVQPAGMKDSPFRTVYLFEFERERRSPLGRRWVITVRSHFTARQLRRTTSTKGPTGLAWLSPVFTLDSALTSSLTTIKLYHHLPSSVRASPSILTLNTRHLSSMPAILATHHRRTTPAATASQSLDKPPPMETTRVAGITQIGPRYYAPDNNRPIMQYTFYMASHGRECPSSKHRACLKATKYPTRRRNTNSDLYEQAQPYNTQRS
jgi:hypothetical protein